MEGCQEVSELFEEVIKSNINTMVDDGTNGEVVKISYANEVEDQIES